MRFAALSTSIALVALSCSPANVAGPLDGGGSPSDGGGSSNDGGRTIDQACSDHTYAFCTRLQMCSPTAMQQRYGSETACRAALTRKCSNAGHAPSTGTSSTTLEECAAATMAWQCGDFLFAQNTPPACMQAIGALANGSPCGVWEQCQSGYCGYALGRACGTCSRLPEPGDSCEETECPNGLSCTGSPPTCSAYAQMGAPCGPTQPCVDGLTCVFGGGGAGGTCQAGVKTEGATCNFNGAGCDYYSGLSCNAESGECATARLSPPGQACGLVENQEQYCIAGNCVRGACVATIPAGGACDVAAGAQCASGTRCILSGDGGTRGTCQYDGASPCR